MGKAMGREAMERVFVVVVMWGCLVLGLRISLGNVVLVRALR